MPQTIQLTIPDTQDPPVGLSQFTPEETWLALHLGCQVLVQARKSVANLDARQLLESEYRDQLIKLQQQVEDAILYRDDLEQRIRQSFQHQVTQLQSHNEQLLQRLAQQELVDEKQVHHLLQLKDTQTHAMLQEKEQRFVGLLQDKDKQIDRLTTAYEALLVQQSSTKSTSQKGSAGEQQFADIAHSTFQDFNHFQLVDKHTQGGEGDFHLHFESFDVLVDAKKYRKKVPVEQRDKIKHDLRKHPHMAFAWLVSLDSTIDKFERAPIMVEWISASQCVLYINHLMNHPDPSQLLRIAWFLCQELNRFILAEAAPEQNEWKERSLHLLERVRGLRKTIRDINSSMNTTRQLVSTLDDEIRTILERQTQDVVESQIAVFNNWWQQYIITDPSATVTSTTLWLHFKERNKAWIDEHGGCTAGLAKFRDFLKVKIPVSHLHYKTKRSDAAFEISELQLKP